MRIYVSFLFFSFWIHYLFIHRSCGHLVIANIVLIFDIYIYIYMVLLSFFFTYLSMRCIFTFNLLDLGWFMSSSNILFKSRVKTMQICSRNK